MIAPKVPPKPQPLVETRDLVKHFPKRGGFLNREIARVHALNGVSLGIAEGETLGVVGESGCGKSTLGKTIARLHEPTGGEVFFGGQEITRLGHRQMTPLRKEMQFVFQDPYSALHPRYTAETMLREVIGLHRVCQASERDGYIGELISKVGLRPDARRRFPHEFSGGQRQRLNIARALAAGPRFLIADEPVSALDVSVQAQILNLLADLRDEMRLTMLFISHDLKVVEHFCDRVAVMYLGRVVEELPSGHSVKGLAERALHPYTRALVAANPIDDPRERRPLAVLSGDVPSPYDPPRGCPFTSRCPLKVARCDEEMPALVEREPGHKVACFEV